MEKIKFQTFCQEYKDQINFWKEGETVRFCSNCWTLSGLKEALDEARDGWIRMGRLTPVNRGLTGDDRV